MGNLEIGMTVFGHNVVDDIVAIAGQSTVASGHEQLTGEKVAIKQLLARPGDPHYEAEKARILREGKLQINSPYVVRAIQVGEQDGELYLVMPFIEGSDLSHYLKSQGGRLPVEEAISIIFQVAEGLQACHEHGIVHRDLKPENIRVCPDGTVRIMDFGICRNVNEKTITSSDGFLGTVAYMSPEQIEDPRKVDHRSDLFSLGAMFYVMLTGRSSAQGQSPASVVRSICRDTPAAPDQIDPSVPAHISQVCMRLLSKRPEDRFQSAAEFVQALQGQPAQPRPGGFCCACGSGLSQAAAFCAFCGASQQGQPQDARCFACGTAAGEAPACSGCGRHFSPSDHRLIFTAGTLAGQAFRIPETTFLTGRDQLSPRDFQISRRHLWVDCLDGKVEVQDAGSANKSYVGGRLIDRATELSVGQELYLAGNIATYTHK